MCTRRSSVSKDLLKIIHKIAEVKNVKDIQFNSFSDFSDIDSFASGLYKVIIKGKRDGIKIRIKILIKWHTKVADRLCFREAYRREYMFVTKVLPIFLHIQRTYMTNEGLKVKFPNYVLASIDYNEEVIVVHILQNYKLLNRFYKMDFAHASLVIRSLAKLHAFSFIAAKLFPRDFEEIKRLFDNDVQYSDLNNIPNSLEWYFNASVSIIFDSEIRLKLQHISNKISLILNRCTAPGDKPVDLVFVDYQMARLASPVTDISYFFFMTSDYEFLKHNYDHLLYIYYATLSASLHECKVNAEEVFPRRIFEEHLKKYSILGLIEALISMKIITAESDEAHKMTEMKHQSCNGLHQFETQNQSLFVNRVNGIANFYFERNYSIDHFVSE
ncbi:unnamed protein product [Leptidea sinapis]|uniref:CHK kinase-like domain-containing protein n=1 Tax=Leptidea sinapis TaxID=189913 RepID=A0A5E4PVM6_9NEOP|nr:unnamed protein product [Leptidea sinapis]